MAEDTVVRSIGALPRSRVGALIMIAGRESIGCPVSVWTTPDAETQE